MIQITWQEDDQPVATFTVSDAVLASFEQYRLTQTAPVQTASGAWASLPKYADIKSLIVGVFTECLVNPALSMFPPEQLAALMKQAKDAQAALDEAKSAAGQGILEAQTKAEPLS